MNLEAFFGGSSNQSSDLLSVTYDIVPHFLLLAQRTGQHRSCVVTIIVRGADNGGTYCSVDVGGRFDVGIVGREQRDDRDELTEQ